MADTEDFQGIFEVDDLGGGYGISFEWVVWLWWSLPWLYY